jgi:hypothetical protein
MNMASENRHRSCSAVMQMSTMLTVGNPSIDLKRVAVDEIVGSAKRAS